MNEKRTFGEFIRANKGKIIKGTIIVVGVVAGIVIIKLLTNRGEEQLLGAIENLNPEELIALEGFKTIGGATNI